MKITKSFFKYSGVIAALVYILFAITAFLHFPGPFGPFNNWLSDLGDPLRNPSGAVIYNMGCIITSILLLTFFIGIFNWAADKRKIKIPLVIAQIFGMITSLTIIAASLFPLGTHTVIHSTVSTFTYLTLDMFESFLAVALFLNPNVKKWLPVFCYSAAITNFITQGLFGLYVGEWIAILSLMILMVIILGQYRKIAYSA